MHSGSIIEDSETSWRLGLLRLFELQDGEVLLLPTGIISRQRAGIISRQSVGIISRQ